MVLDDMDINCPNSMVACMVDGEEDCVQNHNGNAQGVEGLNDSTQIEEALMMEE